jgi:endonuclease I
VLNLNEQTSYPIEESVIEFELIPNAVNSILQAKKINPKYHPGFPAGLAKCLEAIYGYKRLIALVEDLKSQSYDSQNEEHEKMLLELWDNLMPNNKLESRITKQWQEIGFQGIVHSISILIYVYLKYSLFR